MATIANCLKGFKIEQVLNDNAREHRVSVLGGYEGKDGKAIVILSKRHFEIERLQDTLRGSSDEAQIFCNDVYSKYTVQPPPAAAAVTVDLIYPATAKHIAKHTAQERHVVTESPELYRDVTLPYILSIPAGSIKWVYNILDKQAEAERLLFEDPDPTVGFMLHPDLKWSQAQTDELYCIALCNRHDIRSIRDLTADHLPLLINILEKGCKAIHDRFDVTRDRLVVFVHYQPSYYHFHVHFTHVKADAPGAGVAKAHLLTDIIDNISNIAADTYQKKTLTYTVGENEELWKRLSAHTAESADRPEKRPRP